MYVHSPNSCGSIAFLGLMQSDEKEKEKKRARMSEKGDKGAVRGPNDGRQERVEGTRGRTEMQQRASTWKRGEVDRVAARAKQPVAVVPGGRPNRPNRLPRAPRARRVTPLRRIEPILPPKRYTQGAQDERARGAMPPVDYARIEFPRKQPVDYPQFAGKEQPPFIQVT